MRDFNQQFASLPNNWQKILSLLEKRQYDVVLRCLFELQQKAHAENDQVLLHLVTAAYQICESCRQQDKDIHLYEEVYKLAVASEHDTRQQLLHLLMTICSMQSGQEQTTDIVPELPPQPEQSAENSLGRKMWQKLQGYIGLASINQPQPVETEAVHPSDILAKNDVELPPKKSKPDDPIKGQNAAMVIYCLGPFRVYHINQLIEGWNGLKGQHIFKYLITNRSKPVPKDVLMDLFWPEMDVDAARRNLHQAVYSLRQTLKTSHSNFRHILFENDCYLLNSDLDMWLDFEEFEQHVAHGRHHEKNGRIEDAMREYGIAEGLYQGSFLEEDIYEEWTLQKREYLQNQYVQLINVLSRNYQNNQEYTAAIALCQKLLLQDNCCEEAHRRLIECYIAQNQRHLAIRQYQQCQEILAKELNLNPSPETTNIVKRLEQ